ncbi:hypothetical protein GCM10010451_38950 [Streptomyces virens]|uniref:Uncharacterized protein n=1 Tax=Streptomyces virens TaxID=285572 RepID=A0ABP6PQ26_9ACTN|nr:hypothetical protein GCM10010247_06870 [Streptomyces calvus]
MLTLRGGPSVRFGKGRYVRFGRAVPAPPNGLVRALRKAPCAHPRNGPSARPERASERQERITGGGRGKVPVLD